MQTEVALNLQPNDKIKANGEWWTVSRCSAYRAGPVMLDLMADSREFFVTVMVEPMKRFEHEPHVCTC